jgi:16S rRNA (cytosine1402-N4)-methyltransferase
MEMQVLHKPVMVDEVLQYLDPNGKDVILDATVGLGGHAYEIVKKLGVGGQLIGIDRDENALKLTEGRLKEFSDVLRLVHANFNSIDTVLSQLQIEKVDGALFDLGVSSYQLEDASRGFSFDRDGFLDMRMDQAEEKSAFDIVNRLRKDELERVIREFGEERYARRIADFIVERRKNAKLKTTVELRDLVVKAVGGRYRGLRIHPATRTFQAIRIAVNDELSNLEEVITKIIKLLSDKARVCVISFHSLEDRIVKNKFKELAKGKLGMVLTKKPLIPSEQEIAKNPRARSAKLRVFEKREESC